MEPNGNHMKPYEPVVPNVCDCIRREPTASNSESLLYMTTEFDSFFGSLLSRFLEAAESEFHFNRRV